MSNKSKQNQNMTCPKCGGKKEMDWEHDAYYCPTCDIWLEEVCSNTQCCHCEGRPERPSECHTEQN